MIYYIIYYYNKVDLDDKEIKCQNGKELIHEFSLSKWSDGEMMRIKIGIIN